MIQDQKFTFMAYAEKPRSSQKQYRCEKITLKYNLFSIDTV